MPNVAAQQSSSEEVAGRTMRDKKEEQQRPETGRVSPIGIGLFRARGPRAQVAWSIRSFILPPTRTPQATTIFTIDQGLRLRLQRERARAQERAPDKDHVN